MLVIQWAYTLFEADPDTGVVDITFIGDNGSTVDAWSLQLQRLWPLQSPVDSSRKQKS